MQNLAPQAVAKLIAASADVALLVDRKGIIRDLSVGEVNGAEACQRWLGKPWVDTVTVESQPKIVALLQDSGAEPSRRQVNHPVSDGADLPILYTAVPTGRGGFLIAVGRDLSATATLQQQLLEVQQSLERDYWRVRNAETRYRMLFELSSEAVLVLDADSEKVVEANPAAARLIGQSRRRLLGEAFAKSFDPAGQKLVRQMLASVRSTGRADDRKVREAEQGGEFLLAMSLFRQERSVLILARLTPLQAPANATLIAATRSGLLELIERAPDGFVVTDPDGVLITANRAFLDLIEAAAESQARGRPLADWLERGAVDFNLLRAQLGEHGSIGSFSASLRGEYGACTPVEIAAVTAPGDAQPCLGFMIRNLAHRPARPLMNLDGATLRPVAQFTELVGRVPLKELVRESTELIEKLCIEAALKLADHNRASAAELLGVSRQGLYLKLRRYGLVNGDWDSKEDT